MMNPHGPVLSFLYLRLQRCIILVCPGSEWPFLVGAVMLSDITALLKTWRGLDDRLHKAHLYNVWEATVGRDSYNQHF